MNNSVKSIPKDLDCLRPVYKDPSRKMANGIEDNRFIWVGVIHHACALLDIYMPSELTKYLLREAMDRSRAK